MWTILIIAGVIFIVFCAVNEIFSTLNRNEQKRIECIGDLHISKIRGSISNNLPTSEPVKVYDVIYNSKSNHIDVIYSLDHTIYTSYSLINYSELYIESEYLNLIEGSNPILIDKFQELEDYLLANSVILEIDLNNPIEKERMVYNMLRKFIEINKRIYGNR